MIDWANIDLIFGIVKRCVPKEDCIEIYREFDDNMDRLFETELKTDLKHYVEIAKNIYKKENIKEYDVITDEIVEYYFDKYKIKSRINE